MPIDSEETQDETLAVIQDRSGQDLVKDDRDAINCGCGLCRVRALPEDRDSRKDTDVMRVSRRILVITGFWSISVPTIMATETSKTSQLLATAREQMAVGSHDEAIRMMESALESASEQDCRAIVDQLRKSYQVAIHQTRISGRHDLADHYSQNLRLIDSVAGASVSAAVAGGGDDSARLANDSILRNPGGISVPKAAPTAELDEPKSLPEPDAAKPVETGVSDSPAVSSPLPGAARGSDSHSAEQPASSKVRQFDIAEADDAFRAKKYADAGHVYQQLLDTGSLPDSRRGHLAYCRAAALVDRINKGPGDASEWAAIREEIDTIQQIHPDFWFAEYLSDLVRERMSRTSGSGTKSAGEVASAGIMERTANQIRSMNPLRKVSR